MSGLQHFGWFVGQGFGVQGWGYDNYRWGYRWEKPDIWVNAARALDSAGFDFFLFKDGTIVQSYDRLRDVSLGSAEGGPRHEPMLLLPYLLQATTHLGVIPTLNTTHYDPYHAARQIATLYHFDTARVGLNVVTGVEPEAVRNIGSVRRPISHDEAYAKADEWITVVKRLWTSWDRDAVVEDIDGYRYASGDRVHRIDFHGDYFDVAGPGVTLPFQDDGPVLTSPGSSPAGLEYAGRHSDVQFAFGASAEQVRQNRLTVEATAAAHGRDPRSVKVFSVVSPRIVDTPADADAIRRQLGSDDALRRQFAIQSVIFGVDLAAFDLDRPIPIDEIEDPWTRTFLDRTYIDGVEGADRIPFRELAARSVHGAPGALIGTAEQIADHFEAFGEASGHAGFLLNFNADPVNVYTTLGRLVPELKRRGLLRTEWGGSSLREHLDDF